MYGVSNNLGIYNQLYSGMFGSQRSSGLFGSSSNSAANPWNAMVPNFGQINNLLLDKYLTNRYDNVRDKLDALNKQENSVKTFSKGLQESFGDLKSASSSLKAFSNNSLFRPTGYGSTNSDVASVTSQNAATTESKKLDVKQVATKQTAASTAVSSTGNTLAGMSSLKITGQDGKETTMSFNLASSGTTQSHLKQIADTVNGKNLGITAAVTQKDGKSTLTFTADKTGTDAAFSVSGTGNLEKLNLGETQKAQNAIYSVDDGAEQTSQSNDVRLADSDVSVTLKKAGTTQLSRNVVDDSKTVDAVKKFAESYNKALTFANKNASQSQGMRDLAYSLSTTRFQTNALSKVGISVDSAGALSVDEGKLTNALKNDPKSVETLLGGANGLASNAYGKSVNALNQSRNLAPQSASVSYPNYMYGRDKNYLNAYNSGIFLSSLI